MPQDSLEDVRCCKRPTSLRHEDVEGISNLDARTLQDPLKGRQEIVQVETHSRLKLCTLVQALLELLKGDPSQPFLVKVREEGVNLVLLEGLEGTRDDVVESHHVQSLVEVQGRGIEHFFRRQLPGGDGPVKLVQDVVGVHLLEAGGELLIADRSALICVDAGEELEDLGVAQDPLETSSHLLDIQTTRLVLVQEGKEVLH